MIKTGNQVNVVAAFGLAVGGIFGLAGTLVSSPNVQALLWAIDGLALVMATSLLALKYFRAGQDFVAAGFLVFAIGEAILMSGYAGGPAAGIPTFAAGVSLWSLALLLISIPKLFAMPIRLLGLFSAILFLVVAARMFGGEPLLPTSSPLPFYIYPFFVMTFAGWIWELLRERS